jgi:hypothetical protein
MLQNNIVKKLQLFIRIYYILPMTAQTDTRPKIDLYRAAGILIIAIAACLILGEYIIRPLILPNKQPAETPINIDIKLPPDTTEPQKRTGPRCC